MDQIIYCNDLELLKTEMADNGFVDEDGNYTHGMTKTPTIKNGNSSLSLVRNCKLNLNDFTSLESLGTYEEMFTNEDAHNKYLSVYDYKTPVTFMDEDGIEQTYSKPQRIGEFA